MNEFKHTTALPVPDTIIYIDDALPLSNVRSPSFNVRSPPPSNTNHKKITKTELILIPQICICWTLFSLNIYYLVKEPSHYISDLCPKSTMRSYLIVGATQYYIQPFICTPDPSFTKDEDIKMRPYLLIISMGLWIWGLCEFGVVACSNDLIDTKIYTMSIIQTIDLIIVFMYQLIHIILYIKN
jgi:hypothetical protein